MKLSLWFSIGLIVAASSLTWPVWAHTETVTVTITEEGFLPREVTVDASAKVTFINEDTAAHWPASNPHPSHIAYPEFDPGKPIAPGEWWIFNPTKPGTWHYHDHLNAHRQGTLIVTAEQDVTTATKPLLSPTNAPPPISQPSFFTRLKITIIAFFRSLTSFLKTPAQTSPTPTSMSAANFLQLPEKEQYQYLEILAKTQSVEKAWQFVQDTYATGQATPAAHAHDSAHLIGSLIYAQRGLAGLSVCDATFAFGCYHGFTEGAFEKNLDLLNEVAAACTTVGPVSSGPWSSCIHGIGHGVASYYNATDLMPALATCDKLDEGATYCHDGVFMEFASSAPPSFYDRAHPLQPCDTLSLKYQPACGRNIVAAAGKRFGLSPQAVAAACLTAPTAITSACIDTVGFAIAHEEGSRHKLLVERCAAITQPQAAAQCATAAAVELVFQNYPDWQTESAATCQGLAPAYQSYCHQRVQQTIDNYHR